MPTRPAVNACFGVAHGQKPAHKRHHRAHGHNAQPEQHGLAAHCRTGHQPVRSAQHQRRHASNGKFHTGRLVQPPRTPCSKNPAASKWRHRPVWQCPSSPAEASHGVPRQLRGHHVRRAARIREDGTHDNGQHSHHLASRSGRRALHHQEEHHGQHRVNADKQRLNKMPGAGCCSTHNT